MRRRLGVLIVSLWALPGAVLAQPPAATIEYYHLDALGSVRAVTDAQGQVVRRHDYLPFGEEFAAQPGADPVRFTGKERDRETGLDYFGARYLNTRWGRFTTVDPGHVNGNIFDPQSWNAYAYARNNPLRFVDPTGTDYYVQIDGGSGFWFEGSGPFNEFGQLKAFGVGFSFEGGMWGGVIYNAAGLRVGTYTYADKIVHLASDIARRTAPVVDAIGVVVATVDFALSVAHPVASTVAHCLTGGCTGAATTLAVLPSGRAARKLGSLLSLSNQTVAQAIRLRGGTGQTVNRVATWLQHKPLAEVAELAANGNREAETAIKLVKQAAGKAER